MKITKVLETVYIEGRIGLILENGIVIKSIIKQFMTREECFQHIYKNYPGWVQKSDEYRKCKRLGKKTGIETDPLEEYEKLYDELFKYATEKFKDEFKPENVCPQ